MLPRDKAVFLGDRALRIPQSSQLGLTPGQFLRLTLELIEMGTGGQRATSHDGPPSETPEVRQQAERRSYDELSETRWTQSLADGCALMRVTKLPPSRQ